MGNQDLDDVTLIVFDVFLALKLVSRLLETRRGRGGEGDQMKPGTRNTKNQVMLISKNHENCAVSLKTRAQFVLHNVSGWKADTHGNICSSKEDDNEQEEANKTVFFSCRSTTHTNTDVCACSLSPWEQREGP